MEYCQHCIVYGNKEKCYLARGGKEEVTAEVRRENCDLTLEDKMGNLMLVALGAINRNQLKIP